ncbi:MULTISPECIES: sugar phosphate nucleotidyltransferase [unclassified Paenibacillus]|uniref:sugar phosphate nucleotidyltransferase n=1 Tax=unclassified Paenibacillus TaxID=185978 RepID=UPI001C11863C|nr:MULTISPECIES: sugar phosphate nucleotidyltransferase [unclassified Paenibacillus]MBU5440842.1 NTP transferase domain-containing protein [Paenibacillus sp. MSJ-34]CAH0118459.1 Glucose-1-phosphate thymidylyltransferase [Paenibacillus sp. CECT 9249]
MKGIILAGGTGTRLYPLTKLVNKHLLPVGKYPMICYGIERLRRAGIRDILMIIGKASSGLYMDFLGDGSEWGVSLTYRIQSNAGGIAQALGLAKGFVSEGEKFVVLLGDNLFKDDLAPFVKSFREQAVGARVLLKQVADPHRYGVPVFHPERKDEIVKIEEKPSQPKSHYCVTGLYMYDTNVFDIVERLVPSARGELEITDVNNVYAEAGRLQYDVLQEWWTDAGTFESLFEASVMLRGVEP